MTISPLPSISESAPQPVDSGFSPKVNYWVGVVVLIALLAAVLVAFRLLHG